VSAVDQDPSEVELGGRVGLEVLVADADVMFQDAADVLKSEAPSRVLRALDAGTAVAVMSDQAFKELGWNSGLAARGHSVDQAQLRAIIENDYLPRIAVVSVPEAGDQSWVPDTGDVRDPNDVAHVQVARLIRANVVYSHDRHLRIPGFAPRERRDYDARLEQLTVTTSYRETEEAAATAATGVAMGVRYLVVKTATVMGVRPARVGLLLGVLAAFVSYRALSTSERRGRFAEGMHPLMQQVSDATQRRGAAVGHLVATTYVPATNVDRLEVRVAALLVREPDQTMGDIGEALNLDIHARRELSQLLQTHPSFERSSRWGWSMGRARERLETWPRRA
jgi:predicted nucleic acid-binding protein